MGLVRCYSCVVRRNARRGSGLSRTSSRVLLAPLRMISVHVRSCSSRFPPLLMCIYLTVPTESPDVPQDEQQIARSVQALKERLRGRGGRRGGRGISRVQSGSGRDSHPAAE